jgi:hypothetical protein
MTVFSLRSTGAFGICIGLLCLSCGPETAPLPLTASDLIPPVLLGFTTKGSRGLEIEFDEEASFKDGSLALYRRGRESLAPESVSGTPGKKPEILWPEDLEAGAEYRLEGRALDDTGNSVAFYLTFFGFNPRLPEILINEVRTDSSSPQCDLVEFYVKRGGFSGGLCACSGTKEDYDWRYIFPGIELAAGEYLILHLKADESGAGVDETAALDASGGTDSSPLARDLWYPGQEGLTKSNGVLALYENPAGALVDAFLYSDRTKDSDAKYGGFGSAKLRERVKAIVAGAGWSSAGPEAVPEDCASSAGTTETRTLCRSPDSADTNAKADWHIVPTKGASFGSANNPGSYLPSLKARESKTSAKKE